MQNCSGFFHQFVNLKGLMNRMEGGEEKKFNISVFLPKKNLEFKSQNAE